MLGRQGIHILGQKCVTHASLAHAKSLRRYARSASVACAAGLVIHVAQDCHAFPLLIWFLCSSRMPQVLAYIQRAFIRAKVMPERALFVAWVNYAQECHISYASFTYLRAMQAHCLYHMALAHDSAGVCLYMALARCQRYAARRGEAFSSTFIFDGIEAATRTTTGW